MMGLLFTYALTYGGAVMSLFRPWYGLLIYVCFAIIRPESLWFWSVPAGNYSRIIAISLLVGWAINGFGNWKLGKAAAIVWALVAYWFWALISTFVAASNVEVGLHFVEELSKILLPFIAGLTLIDSEKKLKQLAWVILISQGYVALEMNRAYYDGFNRLHEIGFGGMDNNCVAIAMVAASGLAFSLGLHDNTWKRWVAFACAGLMAHSIMFAFSRGGMLGLILTGGVTFLLLDKKPRHFLIFGLAVVAALMLAGPEVRGRFSMAFADDQTRDESAQHRLDMWQDCLQVIGDHPVFGVGPNHWPLIASSYGWPAGKEAHTLWLQISAELGIVGVGFLLAFYLINVARLWPIARRKVPQATEWNVAVARMIIASFAGFMLSAQFVSLEGLELPYYIAILGAGTLKLVSSQSAARVPTFDPYWQTQPMPEVRPAYFPVGKGS